MRHPHSKLAGMAIQAPTNVPATAKAKRKKLAINVAT
jgi:hypothetical protein